MSSEDPEGFTSALVERFAHFSLLLVLLCPTVALAYSNPADFDRESVGGGAGGRHFTGAVGDGYHCSVCHLGGADPIVTLEGLPAEFSPAETYTFTLRFEGGRTGVAFEISARDGGSAGTLTLPDAIPAEGLCIDGTPATTITALADRNVVMVDACGATSMTVDWVAPDEPSAWIYYGVVQGDLSGDPQGDQTWSDVVPLGAEGAPSPGVDGSGCSVAAPRSSLLLIALMVLVWRRR